MNRAVTDLFDRRLLRLRRQRAAGHMVEADFLLRAVVAELCDRVGLIKRSFASALDLGGHTGILAQSLSALPNVGMIIRADPVTELARMQSFMSVVCEEDRLPFAAESVELIVAPLNLHLVNDLPGALIQIAHALKADGLFLAAVLGGNSLTELRQSFLAAESETASGAGMRIAPFIDVRDMGSLLQRAGFSIPVCDVDRLDVTYSDMFALVGDLRRMGMTNMLAMRSRKPLRRSTVVRAGEIYSERFSEGNGRIRATFEIIYATGWKPHESQQKPLQPGSASRRLADALGTEEGVLKR